MTLVGQRKALVDLLNDGRPRTLDEIQQHIGGKHTSISADLRNLRKAKFGSLSICSTPNKMATPLLYWMTSAS